MAKTASASGSKWQQNSGGASQSYLNGAMQTTKSQSGAAIAGKANWAAGVQAAISAGSYEKGLSASGDAGWKAGVTQKGATNYGTGVSASSSLSKYTTNSGKYDTARAAAASVARGPKGSPNNIARVSAVVTAERAVKNGK